LRLDLRDAAIDGAALSGAVDERGVLLLDDDLLCPAQHLQR